MSSRLSIVALAMTLIFTTAAGRAQTSQPDAPLTKAQADEARKTLVADRLKFLRDDRKAEWAADAITIAPHTMRLHKKTYGERPKDGWDLFISMHGGGGAPAKLNDDQWDNQIKLYAKTFKNALVVAPRAPTDNWNLWHEAHIDGLFDRLIEDAVAIEGANPNRVYLMGYSAGGDGAYQLGPRMADRFAAASMMAGHPNDADSLGLRNLPFAIHVGADDAGYDRNAVARQWGEKLDALQKDDLQGYVHDVQLHAGMGHWMKQTDSVAIDWMAKFTRDPLPARVVWKQDDVTHDRFYWLAIPAGDATAGALVIAERKGQSIDIVKAEKVKRLTILLDDRMLDLNQPVFITQGGAELFHGIVQRSLATMKRTLEEHSDADLFFSASATVDLK